MTQTKQQCSTPDQLLTFLRGQLGAREEADLQHHLDDCISCRERLESTAADVSVWKNAREFFASGALHGSSKESSEDHDEAGQGSQRIRHVLDSLGPTDDPQSLGRIGGYEVTGVVGTGGMGVVLKAQDRSLDRIVAIKVMLPHLASSGSARKRFAREAKAAAAVLHPNVIAIHSVASEDANPYLVMPFVRGASLQKRIDAQGPLPLKDTLRIGAQIAAGLAAAHEQGLVHRDIKPANILLEEGVERVTITDFGLARAVDDASMTCSGVIAGTPQYMSPEQARGEPIDARSDLFSLGGVLYAMCTGRSPFRAETTYGVLHRIANDKPTPVCEVNTDVPVWLGHVIERLMAKRPEDRFVSAAQVAESLEGCLAHVQQPAAMSLPEAVTALAPIKTRRPPIGKLIVAAAFVLAFIFAGVFVVLELDKGTLTIQSDVDDIRIRITRGDELIDELTVTKTEQSVRVAAGQYNVEVIGGTDDLTVENGQVTLHRASMEAVRIVHNANNGAATRTAAKNLSADEWLGKLQGKWTVVQQYVNKGVPKRDSYSATVRRNRMELMATDGQHSMLFDLVLGEAGPPQQIDLKPVMSDLERQEMLQAWSDSDEPSPEALVNPIYYGIIELHSNAFRICNHGAPCSPRPIQFTDSSERVIWSFSKSELDESAEVRGTVDSERSTSQKEHELARPADLLSATALAPVTSVVGAQLSSEPSLLWEVSLGGIGFDGAPAIANKVIYLGNGDGRIVALSLLNGQLKWDKKLETGFAAPASVNGDMLFIGDLDGKLHALKATDGSDIWTYETDGEIYAAATCFDDNVLITSEDGVLTCLKQSDGSLNWKYETGGSLRCGATLSGDRIFLGGCDGNLHVVDISNGKSACDPVPLGGPTGSTPAVGQGLAVVPTHSGDVLAFQAVDGKLAWEYRDPNLAHEFRNSVAIAEGLVIASSQNRRVFALSLADGSKRWETTMRKRCDSSPVVAGDKVVLAASDGRVLLLDLKTGAESWSIELKGSFHASPAISDNRLVVASDKGTVYCFGTK